MYIQAARFEMENVPGGVSQPARPVEATMARRGML